MEEGRGVPSSSDLAAAKARLSQLSLVFALLLLPCAVVIASHLLLLFQMESLRPSIPWSPLLLGGFALRCAFITLAAAIGKHSGKTTLDIGLIGTVVAFLVPIYNLFRPFGLVRALTATSATDDLPPVRVVEETKGDYRTSARRERLVPPPATPAPAVLAWQICAALGWVGMFVNRWLWAVLAISAAVLELLVFSRLLQRFRARIAHLDALAAQRDSD